MKAHFLTKSLFATLLVAGPVIGAETQYPAANFEPVIITRDADLIAKHSQAAKTPVSSESASKASKAATTEAAVTHVQKEESSMEIFPIVLVVLALGGLIFWNSRRPAAVVSSAVAAPAVASSVSGGETGVARYLKSLPAGVAETGVAKYLKSLPEKAAVAAETGVAKYLKAQAESTATASAETGVAKYLKTVPEKASSAETGVAKYLKTVG